MYQKRRTWTNEELQLEALKYKHKKEFIEKSSSAYAISWKRNILDSICTHMKPLNNLTKKDLYFLVGKNKQIYIGISFNVYKRYQEHLIRGTSKVKEILYNTHKVITVETNLTIEEALKQENYWISYFKRRKWDVKNQAKGTSIGLHFSPIWNKEKVLLISKAYTKTISNFKLEYPGAYAHALRNKYHAELFEPTKSLNKPKEILFLGKHTTLLELSKLYKLSKKTLDARFRRGDRDYRLIR